MSLQKKNVFSQFCHFQTKYTLIDEQDIPLVENYAFEVNDDWGFTECCLPQDFVFTTSLMVPILNHYITTFVGTHGGRCGRQRSQNLCLRFRHRKRPLGRKAAAWTSLVSNLFIISGAVFFFSIWASGVKLCVLASILIVDLSLMGPTDNNQPRSKWSVSRCLIIVSTVCQNCKMRAVEVSWRQLVEQNRKIWTLTGKCSVADPTLTNPWLLLWKYT